MFYVVVYQKNLGKNFPLIYLRFRSYHEAAERANDYNENGGRLAAYVENI